MTALHVGITARKGHIAHAAWKGKKFSQKKAAPSCVGFPPVSRGANKPQPTWKNENYRANVPEPPLCTLEAFLVGTRPV